MNITSSPELKIFYLNCDAKVFSTCDLSDGFWHLELDEESSFCVHLEHLLGGIGGNDYLLVLVFSPQNFKKCLHQVLEKLPGIKCSVDDILIYGSGSNKSELNWAMTQI